MLRKSSAVAAFFLAACLFLCAFFTEKKLERLKPGFRTSIQVKKNQLPPTFQVLSSLLGGFRTLFVDFLWIRTESLQQEGRYFAASEIARWITMLQSRVEEGWSYQAWNLGFNVPAVLPPEERWPYVYSAMVLLWRDGLNANPESLDLRYEIARLWMDKVSGVMDTAAPLYRKKVLQLTGKILGPRPWDFKEYARAEKLLPLLQKESVVKKFLEELNKFEIKDAEKKWVEIWAEPGKYFGEAGKALGKELKNDSLLWGFDRALRAEAWKKTFGLDMDVVSSTWERYGDIGIGSPESFVVLWMSQGLGLVEKGKIRRDALSLWRMRFRGLRRLFRQGKLQIAEKMNDDYKEIIELVKSDPVYQSQASLFINDRIEFLAQSIPVLFLYGWLKSAENLYDALKVLSPDTTAGLTCSDFAFQAVFSDLAPGSASKLELLSVLKAMLVRSMWLWTRGDEKQSGIYFSFAKDMYYRTVNMFDYNNMPEFGDILGEARSMFRKIRMAGKSEDAGFSGKAGNSVKAREGNS